MVRFDFTLIEKYLKKENINSYDYWVFDEISRGQHLFELPEKQNYELIFDMFENTKTLVENNFIINKEIVEKYMETYVMLMQR
jgi:hypothetical protein